MSKKLKEIEKEVHIILKSFVNRRFKYDLDLFKAEIVDSFDIVNIMSEIEKNHHVKLNFLNDKKFVFSVKNLSRKIYVCRKKTSRN